MSDVLLDTSTVPDLNAPLAAPHLPPAHWFYEIPDWWDEDGALIQIKLNGPDTGRVAVLVAPEGECVLGGSPTGRCWPAPKSVTNYEFSHVGQTVCDDGRPIRTAAIAGAISHVVRDPSVSPVEAAEHYNADTALRQMRVRYHDVPGVGLMALGVVEPGRTLWDAISMMSGATSGDWRHIPSLNHHEFTGAQLVNNPGFRPGARLLRKERLDHRFAVTAALDPTTGEEVWYSMWEPIAPVSELGDRIAALEAVTASLVADLIPDVAISDEDFDNSLFMEVYGHHDCGGAGCPSCGGSGVTPYSADNDFGFDLPALPLG